MTSLKARALERRQPAYMIRRTQERGRFVAQIAMDGALALAIIICVVAFAASAEPAAAEREQTMSEVGRILVAEHCSGCHAIDKDGDSPVEAAPPLRELYERYSDPALVEAFEEGILTNHPAMPTFRFSHDELRAILSYLQSIQDLQTV